MKSNSLVRTFVTSLVVAGSLVACGGGGAGPEPSTPASSGGSSSAPSSGKTESTSGEVGSTQEQEFYTKLNAEMAGFVDTANTACGTKITGVWSTSWHGHWTDTSYGGYGASSTARSACTHAISQVKMVCTDSKAANAKKAVAAKIQKIECAYGNPGKMTAELKGTTLVANIDQDGVATDMAEATGTLLRSKL